VALMISKEKIFEYLRQVGQELSARGMEGEILLTGGAAMCLVHSARDMTKDIDALYEPKAVINEIAAAIAEREGLPSGWLNDGVKGFVGPNAPVENFAAVDGLRIQTVSPEYLLAMKLMSARYGEKDYGDIRFLMKKLDITTSQATSDILLSYFSRTEILPKTQYVIESIIESLNQDETKQISLFARQLLDVPHAIATSAMPGRRYEGEILGVTGDKKYAVMRLSENQAVIHTLAPGQTPPEAGKTAVLVTGSDGTSAAQNREDERAQAQTRGMKR
jgi:hypothetical protein